MYETKDDENDDSDRVWEVADALSESGRVLHEENVQLKARLAIAEASAETARLALRTLAQWCRDDVTFGSKCGGWSVFQQVDNVLSGQAAKRYVEDVALMRKGLELAMLSLGHGRTADGASETRETCREALRTVVAMRDSDYESCPHCRGSFSYSKPRVGVCPHCNCNIHLQAKTTPDKIDSGPTMNKKIDGETCACKGPYHGGCCEYYVERS